MTEKETKKKRFKYKYPNWIMSAQRIERINNAELAPLYVSVLTLSENKKLLDIRIWKDDRPTGRGVFVTQASGMKLIDLLDSFLAGEDLTDQTDGAVEINH